MADSIISGVDGFGHGRRVSYAFSKQGAGTIMISLPAKTVQILSECIDSHEGLDHMGQPEADEMVKLRAALDRVLAIGKDFTPFEWEVSPAGGILRPDEYGS